MTTKRPLKPGTLIDYCGEIAEVVFDNGGSKIDVKIDNTYQSWYWKFEGVECIVVESNSDNIEHYI
jgi:hypothetical protein